jgi:hypothetical protein
MPFRILQLHSPCGNLLLSSARSPSPPRAIRHRGTGGHPCEGAVPVHCNCLPWNADGFRGQVQKCTRSLPRRLANPGAGRGEE